MTDPIREVLTDREQAILEDELPPHLTRWDSDDPPECDHCVRPAGHALILGTAEGGGMYKKDVCDACLERIYGDLEAPLAARLFDTTTQDS